MVSMILSKVKVFRRFAKALASCLSTDWFYLLLGWKDAGCKQQCNFGSEAVCEYMCQNVM